MQFEICHITLIDNKDNYHELKVHGIIYEFEIVKIIEILLLVILIIKRLTNNSYPIFLLLVIFQ